MQIWICERTDFLRTTERRLATLATVLAGGMLVVVVLVGLVVLAGFGLVTAAGALGEIYAAADGSPVPPGVAHLVIGAAFALVVALFLVVLAGMNQFGDRSIATALVRETRPLRYLAPETATEIVLPAGDRR